MSLTCSSTPLSILISHLVQGTLQGSAIATRHWLVSPVSSVQGFSIPHRLGWVALAPTPLLHEKMGLLELLWKLAAHRQRRVQQNAAMDQSEPTTADQSQQETLSTSQTEQKTAVQSETAKVAPHCRLCFETDEEAPLVSPGCACRGSVEHIHLECLQNWQRTLAEQGLFSRALCCEICKQPYAPAFATFPADPKSLPPTFRQRVRELALRTARSPELVFKLWRLSVLASGLVVGARQGAVGAGVGLCLGLKLATPVASFVFKVG